jgi:predicted AlkP superfamily phosphohydrolase/phosphomutase
VYKVAEYDRKEQLRAVHESRKASTFQKVDEAIQRLVRASESINFNSVASEAGVSKATLYNHKEIRERIEGLRIQQANAPTPKQIKRVLNDKNKDAIIDSLHRRIKKLEGENKQLREQLKVVYADVYKSI